MARQDTEVAVLEVAAMVASSCAGTEVAAAAAVWCLPDSGQNAEEIIMP